MRRLIIGIAITGLTAALLVGVLSTSAGAISATFFVRSNGDGAANAANCPANDLAGSTSCRLRDAIAAAAANAGDDTILADAGLATVTLTADLEYTDNDKITLQGQGASNLVIDGASTFGGFHNDSNTGSLEINHVTIQNMAITKSDNSPAVGAIFVSGAVTVLNSTLTHNSATNTQNAQGVGGILVGQSSPLVITNSTLDHNTGTVTNVNGGGVGGTLSGGTVTITNSTFNNNTGTGGSAGIGGVDSCSTIRVTNSTFTANTGVGSQFSVGGVSACTLHLAYDTFVGNTGTTASNVDTDGFESFATVIAGGIGGPNCASTASSDGYNFEDTNTCGFTGTGDHAGAGSPGLGALASNGGPTQTMLPQSGSPLIDAIPNAACQTAPLGTGITADQRAFARPSPAGGACDIGAVEVQPAAPAATLTARFTG